MRILQLCNKPPLPKIDGGCIAIFNISSGLLNANQELHMLTISTHKHPFLPEAYTDTFKDQTRIEGVFVDTRVNVIDAFSALVTSDSYNVSRFFSTDFDLKLSEYLQTETYDIVHLESLFMTPYISTIRRYSKAKIVLRSHNLEHLIWERLANTAGNKAKKIYLKLLASKLKKYEKKTINEVDGIAAISFEDTHRFKELKCKVPLITVPFGIDLEKYPFDEVTSGTDLKIFHIGAMNWAPNLEGINWFLDDMWTKISSLPVSLHLAGREMPASIKSMAGDKVFVYDAIDHAINFMLKHEVMIVPLLSGSGMRVKIIEGMALGRVVITTTIGAEGIDFEDGKHLLIANTPKQFYQQIKKLIDNKNLASEIASQARALVEEKYNNSKITNTLLEFYDVLLNSKID